MSARFFPRSDAGLLVWLANFQSTLPAQAKALGLAPGEIKEALDQAKALATAIQIDEQKYADWQAAVAKTAELRDQAQTEIRRIIDRLRTAPSYTEETAKSLMAVPVKPVAKSLDDHKPVIRASYSGGKVRIHWTRGALDGVNVYSRKPGSEVWVLLGRDTRPPYDDLRPAVSAGEVREYRAIGVSHDEEVGHPSDTVLATLGG